MKRLITFRLSSLGEYNRGHIDVQGLGDGHGHCLGNVEADGLGDDLVSDGLDGKDHDVPVAGALQRGRDGVHQLQQIHLHSILSTFY